MKYIVIIICNLLSLFMYAADGSVPITYTNNYIASNHLFQLTCKQKDNNNIEISIADVNNLSKTDSTSMQIDRLDAFSFAIQFTSLLSKLYTGKDSLSATITFWVSTQVFRDVNSQYAKLYQSDNTPSGTLSLSPWVFPSSALCNAYGFECQDCDDADYLDILNKEYTVYYNIYHFIRNRGDVRKRLGFRFKEYIDTTLQNSRSNKANNVKLPSTSALDSCGLILSLGAEMDTFNAVYRLFYDTISRIYLRKYAKACPTCSLPQYYNGDGSGLKSDNSLDVVGILFRDTLICSASAKQDSSRGIKKVTERELEKYFNRNVSVMEELIEQMISKVQRNQAITATDLKILNGLFLDIKAPYYRNTKKRLYTLYNDEKMFFEGLLDMDTFLMSSIINKSYNNAILDSLQFELRKLQKDSLNQFDTTKIEVDTISGYKKLNKRHTSDYGTIYKSNSETDYQLDRSSLLSCQGYRDNAEKSSTGKFARAVDSLRIYVFKTKNQKFKWQTTDEEDF